MRTCLSQPLSLSVTTATAQGPLPSLRCVHGVKCCASVVGAACGFPGRQVAPTAYDYDGDGYVDLFVAIYDPGLDPDDNTDRNVLPGSDISATSQWWCQVRTLRFTALLLNVFCPPSPSKRTRIISSRRLLHPIRANHPVSLAVLLSHSISRNMWGLRYTMSRAIKIYLWPSPKTNPSLK